MPSESFIKLRSAVLREKLVKNKSSEEYSVNIYSLPVPKGKVTAAGSKGISPAHVGHLKNSIDFYVPEGTPVFAAADGRISYLRKSSNVGGTDIRYWDTGNYIDVRHENGEYTWYEHLRFHGVNVRRGQEVLRGQLIGYSGNTGFSESPHLHFAVNKYYGTGFEDYVTLKARFDNFRDVYRKR